MKSIFIKSSLVTVNWLQSNFKADNLILLDATIPKVAAVKTEKEVELIPKSSFFDIKTKFSNTDAKFPNTVPSQEQFEAEAQKLGINANSAILVYDTHGMYSSARAWWLFRYFGHNNVAVLDGGLPEWKNKSFKTVTAYRENDEIGNFKAVVHNKLITDFEGIQEYAKDDTVQIIDARSAKRFSGETPEPRKGLRSGTIPNSISLPFSELLNENMFKTKTELKSVFDSILKNKNHYLVFSCGSGITACNLALGATLVGYDKFSVYDGSWTEYGTKITNSIS